MSSWTWEQWSPVATEPIFVCCSTIVLPSDTVRYTCRTYTDAYRKAISYVLWFYPGTREETHISERSLKCGRSDEQADVDPQRITSPHLSETLCENLQTEPLANENWWWLFPGLVPRSFPYWTGNEANWFLTSGACVHVRFSSMLCKSEDVVALLISSKICLATIPHFLAPAEQSILSMTSGNGVIGCGKISRFLILNTQHTFTQVFGYCQPVQGAVLA